MSSGKQLAAALVACAVLAGPVAAAEKERGVKIGKPSIVRKLYSEDRLEATASLQYSQLTREAYGKRALLGENEPQVQRVRRIATALLPGAAKFNDRAKNWAWDVNVINSGNINAFCMPGGKIVVFSGILDKLKLTEDEVAMVVGHEIAHALREHARERAAKGMLTNLAAAAVSIFIGGNAGEIARQGGGLLALKFSRSDETEADLVGMELAARAGYDPRAGVTLWEKMALAAKGAPPQWFSTHPSSRSRVETIKKNLPDVLPLYEEAKAGRKG